MDNINYYNEIHRICTFIAQSLNGIIVDEREPCQTNFIFLVFSFLHIHCFAHDKFVSDIWNPCASAQASHKLCSINDAQ